ncbi:MAG: hypothetical protein KDE48_20950 [Anaerolineales bacterium]|nr:hypothetical protein [Anaerolineales bacterium]
MFYVIGGVILLVIFVGIFWYKTHCPQCRRVFTRKLEKKEKAGLLPTAISGKERRHYRCSHCGHLWEQEVYTDGV